MRTKAFKAAFPYTVPVLMGYLFLGIAYGVLLTEQGFPWIWALLTSVAIYAGSMQFVAIGLMASAFNPIQTALMTLMVNARHIFYGFSMLEPFKNMGAFKPYLIFSLSDETYSIHCGTTVPDGIDEKWFRFFVSILDQSYWVIGTMIGAIAGNFIPFDSTGIDFAMTALFLVIFTEQWENSKCKIPAVAGLIITILCRVICGPNNFLLFSMAGIAIALIVFKKQIERVQE